MESRYPSCYCKVTKEKIKVKFLAKDNKRYGTLFIPTHILLYEKFNSHVTENFESLKKKKSFGYAKPLQSELLL